jgi:hypothetical protein
MVKPGVSKFLNAGARTGLPDDILIKIGEITLNWNHAESALEELTWIIAGWSRTTGAFVTHDMGNVARDQLCRNLLHNRLSDDTLKMDLVDLLSFVSELRIRRNNLIHSIPTNQLSTDNLPQLEKRSTKAATGQIRVSQFLVSEIDDLRLDISMAAYVTAFSKYFVRRDIDFLRDLPARLASERHGHIWGKQEGLPYISQIRNRLRTIRSQSQQPNRIQPPPQSSAV